MCKCSNCSNGCGDFCQPECSLHKFFISFNLILCAIVSVVSIIPPIQEGMIDALSCSLLTADTSVLLFSLFSLNWN